MTGKEMNKNYSWENLTEKDLLEEQRVNKMIILKLVWMHQSMDRYSNRLL